MHFFVLGSYISAVFNLIDFLLIIVSPPVISILPSCKTIAEWLYRGITNLGFRESIINNIENNTRTIKKQITNNLHPLFTLKASSINFCIVPLKQPLHLSDQVQQH